jgi:AcrR family transcriptional regulator
MKAMGRPPFQPSMAMRRQVETARFGGASLEAIARSLNISPATLRNHFAEEIEFGHARKLAQNLSRLDKAASKGSVAAMMHLDKLMSKRS